jgi:hypothetical protein
MFVSYNYKKYSGYKDGRYIWEYELTDSEFGIVPVIRAGVSRNVDVVIAIIQEYTKRNLNVAANIVASFVWYNKLNPNWSIQTLIYHNRQYNPLFSQYEKDLQKYLVLL